ncbi:MAG TPA: hypothetical protein VHX38_02980 [Pseudonocardiaceae bacterium]|nr:hypothetical protein [Pseudonocardiaceae bacterium]
MSEREYRIEYTIQANDDKGWTEIGFGSSGAWDSVDESLYAIESYIQNRQWDTEPGMPDPKELEAGR